MRRAVMRSKDSRLRRAKRVACQNWLRLRRAILVWLILLAGCCAGCSGSNSQPSAPAAQSEFANPQAITLLGYSGDAMEPFLSRDGKYLFFNSLNTTVPTKLYWATQVDPLIFQFQGEIGSVNTATLDAVASMDGSGNFYFISNRSYGQSLSTVYAGTFGNGSVSAVEAVPGISAPMAGLVDFDAEISADGNTLYFSEGHFDSAGNPQTSQIIMATRGMSGFTRSAQSATLMQQINTNTLNYAADTSASQLELFFTRLDPSGPAIYMAARTDTALPFGAPTKISAITGFAEAPSLSPDGKSLYYHKKDSRFAIYRVTRP